MGYKISDVFDELEDATRTKKRDKKRSYSLKSRKKVLKTKAIEKKKKAKSVAVKALRAFTKKQSEFMRAAKKDALYSEKDRF